MPTATMTSKGQVTLPKSIRDSLQLKTGDKIEIIIQGNKAIITPISVGVDDSFGMLQTKAHSPLTVDEMDEAIAQKMKEKYRK